MISTVSVGKGFGSTGKQHHKHIASETQSHNKWSHQIFFAIYMPLPGCVALPENGLWNHGAGEAAADRSQGSHSVSDIWHETCNIFSKFQLSSFYGLCEMMCWRFEGKGWLNDWTNEWITKVFVKQPRLHRSVNHKAICRTVPATPGLLIIYLFIT